MQELKKSLTTLVNNLKKNTRNMKNWLKTRKNGKERMCLVSYAMTLKKTVIMKTFSFRRVPNRVKALKHLKGQLNSLSLEFSRAFVLTPLLKKEGLTLKQSRSKTEPLSTKTSSKNYS